MTKGMIHVYTGDGKGKTTAAVGIAVRAKSRGLRIMFAQFFKEDDPGGEIGMLRQIGIETLVFHTVKSPFFNPGLDRSAIRREALKALSHLTGVLRKEGLDLLVLDEFICLISEEVLTEDEAITFLKNKPGSLEIVLTGAGAGENILSLADYATYMKNLKHPYDRKLDARPGIEF